MFLSGSGHSPCANGNTAAGDAGDGDPPVGAGPLLPSESRSNYLPVVELSRRLASLIALNVGLAERLPDFMWRRTPGPAPACRELDDLIAHLDEIEEAASAARSTCLFLWEIAAAESERLREDS